MVSKPKSARKPIENEPAFRKRKSGSNTGEVMDALGRSTSDKRKTIAPKQDKEPQPPLNENLEPCGDVGTMQADDGSNVFYQLPKAIVETIDQMTKQELSTPVPPVDELVDNISFSDGKNTLKIVFIKKQNRMYRIQIFLNDNMEIRPATYTGSNTAEMFWKLLKGSLKT